MLKIGELSKLSMLTVKTLRFYEKEGLLEPASVDAWTGYRLYETAQLQLAARIKAYRQLGEAYAFIYKYDEDNGYRVAGLSRECYIDGVWNKDEVNDWLTEVQLPVE